MYTGINTIFVTGTLSIFVLVAPATEQTWTYVVPVEAQRLGRPAWRALALSDKCPDGISEQVTYRGQRRSYTQIRYGNSNSVRVVVVLDQRSSGKADLYVDANRDRKIDATDRIVGTSGQWRVSLMTAASRSDSFVPPARRTLALRLGQILHALSATTMGYVQGQVHIDGRTVPARRVDADANGRFADLQDRIWLDLNEDGRWDALTEQFAVRPILELPSGRYAVAADLLGESLMLKKLEGTGTFVLAAAGQIKTTRILDITTAFVGRDGGVFALRGNASELTAPVGQYRIHSLVVVARQDAESPPWEFVFNREGRRPPRWFDLMRDSRLEINPLDRFVLTVEGVDDTCWPGQSLSVQPCVYTGDGLSINACTHYVGGRSTGQDAAQAIMELSSSDGIRPVSMTSGFA